jgi:hypothetical protein
MKAHSAVPILVVAGCLAGCAGTGTSDVDAKKEDKAMATETAKSFDSIDDTRCRSFGYQPGSSAYAQCRSDYAKIHKQGDSE